MMVKNYLWTSTKQESISDIGLISIEKDLMKNLDF